MTVVIIVTFVLAKIFLCMGENIHSSFHEHFSSNQERIDFYNNFNSTYNSVGQKYEEFIKRVNPKLSSKEVRSIAQSIIFYTILFNRGEKVEIDPRLIVAIIYCESKFKPDSVSKKGAKGLGQIMPSTAKFFRTYPDYLLNPVINVYGTVKIFRNYLNRYQHLPPYYQLQYALAAYNAGPAAVERNGGIPPYPETQNFINNVIRVYRQLAPTGNMIRE